MHLGQQVVVEVTLEVDGEGLPLTDRRDTAEAEAPEGTFHGLALRVEDLGLEHDVDDDAGHVSSRRSWVGWRLQKHTHPTGHPRPSGAGRDHPAVSA